MTDRSIQSPMFTAAFALLALTFSPADAAAAACKDGQTKSCVTADGCPGTMWCEWPGWGECLQSGSCVVDPFGNLDVVQLSPGADQIRVAGWAIDQNSPTTPLSVRISVDGVARVQLSANGHRPDVGSAYPDAGSLHGFDTTLPAEAWGRHAVCVEAFNVGAGANAFLGCRYYTIQGKVSEEWGRPDVTRCVADPVGAINNLPRVGNNIGFLTSTSSEGLGYMLLTPHLQSVQRLAYGDGRHLVVSRSGSLAFYVVEMAGQNTLGLPFGGLTQSDHVVHREPAPSLDFDHAGGIQTLGTLLAVPYSSDDEAFLRFYDLSTPASPVMLHEWEDPVFSHAGAVALARLANDFVFMIVGEEDSEYLNFYIGTADPPDFVHLQRWRDRDAQTEIGDDEFASYQSLNLVTRCGDGQMFLVGMDRDGSGDDWVDLFRVNVTRDSASLTKVAKRNIVCSGQCNLDASGGTYVAPDGRLMVYATEHGASGPTLNGVRSVTARQFF